MGNEASAYMGLSSSSSAAKKEKGPELIDEFDTETRTWRKVPVVDEDEELVAVPPQKKTKLELVKDFFAKHAPPKTTTIPRRWLMTALATLFLAAVLAYAVSGTSDRKFVRVDSAKPLSAFLGAADAARVKRRLAEHIAADDFRKILAKVSQPLTLTFTVLANGDEPDSDATLSYRGELLLARCSKPTSRACDLVFKPPPSHKKNNDRPKQKWWSSLFPPILRGGL